MDALENTVKREARTEAKRIVGALVDAARTAVNEAKKTALARFDVPTLDVSPAQGVAQLRWDFEPTPRALDAAIRVLTSIRETRPVAVPLRR